jgi:hypothetical protein
VRPGEETVSQNPSRRAAENLRKKRFLKSEKGRAMLARKRAKYRIQRKAHRAVADAIERGKLVREPCIICGSPEVEAHHPDHRERLKVVWLCRNHHLGVHRGTLTEIHAL